MQSDYQKLFQNLTNPAPSPDLLGKILMEIKARQKARIRRHFYLVCTLMAITLFAFYPVVQSFLSDLTQSGFLYFSSLMFSDLEAISGFWQTYAFSLLETLPVTGLLLSTGLLLIFLQSLQYLVRDLRLLYFQKNYN